MRRQLRQKRNLKKQKSRRSFRLLAIIIISTIFLIVVSLALFIWKVMTLTRFIYVEKTDNGGAVVTVVDSKYNQIDQVTIDEDIELNVSHGLGEYKLQSIWKLGEKEGYQGDLVAKTIVKNYGLPVYLWKNDNNSNLSLLQKVFLKLYKLKLLRLNLSEYKAESTKLPLYVSTGFSDNRITEKLTTVEIEDVSGNYKTTADISRVLNIMGAKITNYSRSESKDIDCLVNGKNIYATEEIAKVLDCLYDDKLETESGVKIKIGKYFNQRF